MLSWSGSDVSFFRGQSQQIREWMQRPALSLVLEELGLLEVIMLPRMGNSLISTGNMVLV